MATTTNEERQAVPDLAARLATIDRNRRLATPVVPATTQVGAADRTEDFIWFDDLGDLAPPSPPARDYRGRTGVEKA